MDLVLDFDLDLLLLEDFFEDPEECEVDDSRRLLLLFDRAVSREIISSSSMISSRSVILFDLRCDDRLLDEPREAGFEDPAVE